MKKLHKLDIIIISYQGSSYKTLVAEESLAQFEFESQEEVKLKKILFRGKYCYDHWDPRKNFIVEAVAEQSFPLTML